LPGQLEKVLTKVENATLTCGNSSKFHGVKEERKGVDGRCKKKTLSNAQETRDNARSPRGSWKTAHFVRNELGGCAIFDNKGSQWERK